jgi:hypothetical protein
MVSVDLRGRQLRAMAMREGGAGPLKEDSLRACGITSPLDLKSIETFLSMPRAGTDGSRKVTLKSLGAQMEDVRCSLNKQIGHERDVRTELEHRCVPVLRVFLASKRR